MPYTAYNSVAKMGLAASGAAVKEQYIPLWVHSSSDATTNQMGTGLAWLQKGSTSSATTSSSATKLHTLNTNWPANQKFALECSLIVNTSSTGYAALWDFTSNAIVSGSTISASSIMEVRSSTFTLIAGHVYGVTFWTASSSFPAGVSKAHLVAIN